MDLQLSRIIVVYCSLIVGSICFILFLIDVIISILIKNKSQAFSQRNLAESQLGLNNIPSASLEDMSKLIDSISKLTELLLKARLAIVSVIASFLFYLLATIGSGALSSPLSNADIDGGKATNEPAGQRDQNDDKEDKSTTKPLKHRKETPAPPKPIE